MKLVDANHDEKPEGCAMVKTLFGRSDDSGPTPGFVLFPHILHFIGECYQMVPDNHRHRREHEILQTDRFSGGNLGAVFKPDLGDQASIARSVSIGIKEQ